MTAALSQVNSSGLSFGVSAENLGAKCCYNWLNYYNLREGCKKKDVGRYATLNLWDKRLYTAVSRKFALQKHKRVRDNVGRYYG